MDELESRSREWCEVHACVGEFLWLTHTGHGRAKIRVSATNSSLVASQRPAGLLSLGIDLSFLDFQTKIPSDFAYLAPVPFSTNFIILATGD